MKILSPWVLLLARLKYRHQVLSVLLPCLFLRIALLLVVACEASNETTNICPKIVFTLTHLSRALEFFLGKWKESFSKRKIFFFKIPNCHHLYQIYTDWKSEYTNKWESLEKTVFYFETPIFFLALTTYLAVAFMAVTRSASFLVAVLDLRNIILVSNRWRLVNGTLLHVPAWIGRRAPSSTETSRLQTSNAAHSK